MGLYRIKGTDEILYISTDNITDYIEKLEDAHLGVEFRGCSSHQLFINGDYIGDSYEDEEQFWEALEKAGAIEELSEEEKERYWKSL